MLNFTSGIRLTKSINSSRGGWVQQHHVLPSAYKGCDAEFCVRKQQASCLSWNNFCSLNGKRHQFNSFNSTFILNSTNKSSTTSQSTLHHHVDESPPRFVTTREEDLNEISQHIYGNPISFCVVQPKLSKVTGVTF